MLKFIVLSVFFPVFIFSQDFSIGIKGGLNYFNFRGESIDGLNFNHATNFHFGAVTQVEFSVNFKMQVDLLYDIIGTEVKTLAEQYENKMGYISIPLALKLAVSNRRTFIEGGTQISYLLSDRRESLTAIQQANWETKNNLELGVFVGLSFHITDNLFVQGRYHWGLTDVKIINDKSFTNQGVSFALGYYLF